jgi:hypothetical protein
MKRKLMWLTAIGAVMALAYAQSVTIRGAVGFGLAGAPDAERPNAQFNFSVKQAEYNGQTRLGGGFAIEVREANRLVSIHMANARRLEVDTENKVATFGGPAFAVERTRQGVQRARGVVVVRVDDNRTRATRRATPIRLPSPSSRTPTARSLPTPIGASCAAATSWSSKRPVPANANPLTILRAPPPKTGVGRAFCGRNPPTAPRTPLMASARMPPGIARHSARRCQEGDLWRAPCERMCFATRCSSASRKYLSRRRDQAKP